MGDYSQAVHRAVIKVPDERLGKLAEIVQPQRVTPAEIEFLDAAGFTGKGKQATDLEITQDLRQMEAFVMVVDAFSPDANPETDIRNLIDEMILLDQALVEGIIAKHERKAKLTGDKSEARHVELLHRCLAALEEERLLIEMDFADNEDRILRGYQFLTRKPVLIVLNIVEQSLPETERVLEQYRHFAAAGRRDLAVLCGEIEMELAALENAERQAFLNDLGIATPAVQQVIQKSYSLLGLISFLTVDGPEVRAWPVRKGTIAHRAAGVVHSDMERGFIRAEVVPFEDFVQYKTPQTLKAAGKMRLEGKEYVVQDGDVIFFRFNV